MRLRIAVVVAAWMSCGAALAGTSAESKGGNAAQRRWATLRAASAPQLAQPNERRAGADTVRRVPVKRGVNVRRSTGDARCNGSSVTRPRPSNEGCSPSDRPIHVDHYGGGTVRPIVAASGGVLYSGDPSPCASRVPFPGTTVPQWRPHANVQLVPEVLPTGGIVFRRR